jgi:hypothetical protein
MVEDWEGGVEGEVEIRRLRTGGSDDKTFERGSRKGRWKRGKGNEVEGNKGH